MKLLEGKRGLILGVANERSIAWGIAKACHDEGAELAFTYLNEGLAKRVVPLAESVGSQNVFPCDVQNDVQIEAVFESIKGLWGSLDFVVHSVAYAKNTDLKDRFCLTSRDGFLLAMDISVYSLIAVARFARPLMANGGSLLTLSYLGAVSVVPNYRIMGVCKAALEASVRELAADMGPEAIRVNAISAGPIRTLAASGISDFRDLLSGFSERSPLKRLTTIEDVGLSAVSLLSNLSLAITGEVLYVDCGFNITAV